MYLWDVLQTIEWMSNKTNFELSSGDMALWLDMIGKVNGISQAEKFFESLSSSSRTDKLHGALLNSYAEVRSLDKAEALFQKMRDSGFLKMAIPYNVMLTLYSRMGKHEKIEPLVREMENNGIKSDDFTYSIRLNALAAASDVEGIEKLLMERENDPEVPMDVHAYLTAAKGYLKAGLVEKALTTLGKSEPLVNATGRRIDLEHLMTMYASTGNKDEVFRIWNRYKETGKMFNSAYLGLLSSLVKLNDIDAAEKIFREWESGRTQFDSRVVNFMIGAYCKEGMFETALSCVERVSSGTSENEAGVWQRLAGLCFDDGRVEMAVDCMKRAVSANGRMRKLRRSTAAGCIEYLKGLGNRESAHEFLVSLKERGALSPGNYTVLVDLVNGDKDSGALDAMEFESESPRDMSGKDMN